jgi:nucleoside 2-deoxyribosyltransferase
MRTKINCYLSAAASYDLSKIEAILDKLHIGHHSFYDFSIGTTFSDLIRRKIREADFVITVLEQEAPNIIYELGVAEGLRKPVFVLVDKDYKPPYFLAGQVYLQTNFQDLSLAELAISNFVKDLGAKHKKQQAPDGSDTLTVDDTNDLLMRIARLREEPGGQEIIAIIRQLFLSINVQSEATYQSSLGKGMDLIIRSKKLSPYFGDMIFVEVKAGNLRNESIISAQEHLLKAIDNSVAHGGLVLYLDKNKQRFEGMSAIPNILCFDLEDFVNGIASEGFEKLLLQTRNKLAHGHR